MDTIYIYITDCPIYHTKSLIRYIRQRSEYSCKKLWNGVFSIIRLYCTFSSKLINEKIEILMKFTFWYS